MKNRATSGRSGSSDIPVFSQTIAFAAAVSASCNCIAPKKINIKITIQNHFPRIGRRADKLSIELHPSSSLLICEQYKVIYKVNKIQALLLAFGSGGNAGTL